MGSKKLISKTGIGQVLIQALGMTRKLSICFLILSKYTGKSKPIIAKGYKPGKKYFKLKEPSFLRKLLNPL